MISEIRRIIPPGAKMTSSARDKVVILGVGGNFVRARAFLSLWGGAGLPAKGGRRVF